MTALELILAGFLLVTIALSLVSQGAAYRNGVTDGYGYSKEPTCSGYRRAGEYLKAVMAHRWPELLYEPHEWVGGLMKSCVRCGATKVLNQGGNQPCDPSKLAGKTEPCCKCGESYPRADLISGFIYCLKCRDEYLKPAALVMNESNGTAAPDQMVRVQSHRVEGEPCFVVRVDGPDFGGWFTGYSKTVPKSAAIVNVVRAATFFVTRREAQLIVDELLKNPKYHERTKPDAAAGT